MRTEMRCSDPIVLIRFFPGHFGTLFTCLREPDRDRLLAALYNSTLTRLARAKRSSLLSAHSAFDRFTCSLAIFVIGFLRRSGTLFLGHDYSPHF